MVINDTMNESLAVIMQRVPQLHNDVRETDLNGEQIAKRLVDVYRDTEDFETRQHIMEFMTEAGYVWLRRLFTRDEQQNFRQEKDFRLEVVPA